jgi:hypothetical protein
VVWTTASATFIRTWFVITMFKLRCILCRELLCNLWWWPLNLVRSWLLCEMVWNPSGFHGLPGYTGLSLLNCPLIGWFSYLISYNWAVLLQWLCVVPYHTWPGVYCDVEVPALRRRHPQRCPRSRIGEVVRRHLCYEWYHRLWSGNEVPAIRC